MTEDPTLIEWVVKKYNVDRSLAYDCVKFGSGWRVLFALLESNLYDRTKGNVRKAYFPGFPGFEEIGLKWEEEVEIGRMLTILFPTMVKAVKQDRQARDKMKAIERIIKNDLFELRNHDIKDLAEKSYNESRARAWDIRRMMGFISYVVTPKEVGVKSILSGKVKLLDREYVKAGHLWGIQAQEIWNPKATLQSLAVQIYLRELEKQGKSIDSDSLKRDMREARTWHSKNPDKFTSHPVLINTFDHKGVLIQTEELPVGDVSFIADSGV